MNETTYHIPRGRFPKPLCFALVSDLHGADPTRVIEALRKKSPDYILLSGDIFETLDGTRDERFDHALTLLREAAKIAPTLYCTGNHEDGSTRSWNPFHNIPIKERAYDGRDLQAIEETGVQMLTDEWLLKDGIAFGGLCSGLLHEGRQPETAWLADFCRADAPRVLLCHHPEYYKKYLKNLPLDLIVSGHAHGGQWRIFGRGVFAPGQGIFPKYTSGIHDGHFVISKGLKPSGKIPRIFNPIETVWICTD